MNEHELGERIAEIAKTAENYALDMAIQELESLRKAYDEMEHLEGERGTQHWMDWKRVRNKIGDRVAALQLRKIN